MVLAALMVFAVLVAPVLIGPIKRNVELFFLVAGVATACLMGQFSSALLWAALREPLSFTLAVLVFGAGFRFLRDFLIRMKRKRWCRTSAGRPGGSTQRRLSDFIEGF